MTTQSVLHAETFRADQVHIILRGDLPERAHRWAVAALQRALRHQRGPLTTARVTLRRADRGEVYRADMLVAFRGTVLRAHAEAADPQLALDQAAERLHRQADGLHRWRVTARTAHARARGHATPAHRTD